MAEDEELAPTASRADPNGGATGDWVAATSPPQSDAGAGATITREPGPTPGPGHPERRTLSDATERMEEPGSPQGLPQIPGFRVEKVIGRGGMGVVYRAVHLELDRVVALKVIYPRGREQYYVRGRFEREVQTLAEIDHPNVVPIYHAGHWSGFPYFTMKLIAGGPLSQQLNRFRGNPEASARIILKVARAVQALHDAKIIHRDLKPLNILLGDGDEPLVADFGLAKWLDDPGSDYTGTGVPIGTRQYMAPEQTLGQKASYTAACDIWALGVTLYELLAGRRPFTDDGTTELQEQIRTHEPPALPESTPAGLVAVVGKCLAKQPTERYPEASAVADELERWLAGQPVIAPPPAPPDPPKPRSTRSWVIAAGVFALLALIALPASLVWSNRPAEPPKPPSVAERLERGQTVDLIGEDGLPKVLDMPGGHVGTVTAHAAGICAVGTSDYALIELVQGTLPVPVTLEAEVAVVTGRTLSEGGFYFGRRGFPGPRRGYQTFYLASVNGPPGGPVAPGGWTNRALLATRLLRPHDPVSRRVQFDAGLFFDPPPFKPNPAPDWRSLKIRLSAEGLQPELLGKPFPTVPMTFSIDRLAEVSVEVPNRPKLAAPQDGDGFGLFVCSGTALFRNVRLVPDVRAK